MTVNRAPQNGFTLVEIMIVIVVLGIIVSVASPLYLANIRHSKEIQCMANRQAVERAAIVHYGEIDKLSGGMIPKIEELVSMGYFDAIPECPCGGVYVWAQNVYVEGKLPLLGCSVHYIPPGNP